MDKGRSNIEGETSRETQKSRKELHWKVERQYQQGGAEKQQNNSLLDKTCMQLLSRLQVKGMPKVAEKLDGKWWGKGSVSSAGNSGSRKKKGDRAAGRVVESKMTIRQGTEIGEER